MKPLQNSEDTEENMANMANIPKNPEFLSEQPKQDIASIVIGNISIPPELIQDYWHLLSEVAVISNLTDQDIYRFEKMYVDWECDFLMEIPHRKLNKKVELVFVKPDGSAELREFGLNELLDRLRQTFSFQLTRSRGGFTLNKLTEMRSVYKEEKDKEKKGWSLFGK